ncbi:putative short-chain dehydrogenase/reductase family protein [Mariannaea sp. PMI_226]|nr:putative short-chain dehydrogenase/reductase family protein [Mariannaea sp. PMI_226]
MAARVPTQSHGLPLLATSENVSGRTYIVTGANTGLGFEASKHLVALGAAKVILAVRNLDSGETAKAKIEQDTGKTNIAQVWHLDLSSYDSVKAFAKKAIDELERIDAIIENAAVAVSQRQFSEGHLRTFTVNVLSTLLLALLLLPKLKEVSTKFGILPHIAFISSSVGFDVKEIFDTIKNDPLVGMDSEDLDIMRTYPLSKLLETFAVRELASLLPVDQTGVVINLVCPGLCKTELGRNAPPEVHDRLKELHEKYGRTAEDGSRTLLFGAVAGRESHGQFLDSCEIADDKVPDWVKDEEGKRSQQNLWNAIAKELDIVEPGCVERALQL